MESKDFIKMLLKDTIFKKFHQDNNKRLKFG